MKKLALLLIFGLISAVNAESVCKERDSHNDFGIAKLLDDKYHHKYPPSKAQERKNEQLKVAWSKLLSRSYIGEIKRSDKELLCLSMDIAITDYLKVALTPQEIERFERFLVRYNGYKSYEKNKNDYLNALKFLKHFDKVEYWYSLGHNENIWQLVNGVDKITNYNKNPSVYAERFVYDKSLGDAFQFQEKYNDYSLNGMKSMQNRFGEEGKYCVDVLSVNASCYDIKDLRYVIQWAESKIKEAK